MSNRNEKEARNGFTSLKTKDFMDCAMQMEFNGIYVSFERNFSKCEELINQTNVAC